MGYNEGIKWARDCYVEVEYQLDCMKGWTDDLALYLDDDLNAENSEEIEADLQDKVNTYDDFICAVQDLMTAAQDVQKGLDRAREAAESYENGEAA